jgi:hypothetical protein
MIYPPFVLLHKSFFSNWTHNLKLLVLKGFSLFMFVKQMNQVKDSYILLELTSACFHRAFWIGVLCWSYWVLHCSAFESILWLDPESHGDR